MRTHAAFTFLVAAAIAASDAFGRGAEPSGKAAAAAVGREDKAKQKTTPAKAAKPEADAASTARSASRRKRVGLCDGS